MDKHAEVKSDEIRWMGLLKVIVERPECTLGFFGSKQSISRCVEKKGPDLSHDGLWESQRDAGCGSSQAHPHPRCDAIITKAAATNTPPRIPKPGQARAPGKSSSSQSFDAEIEQFKI